MDKVQVEWVDSCRVFFEWTDHPEEEIKGYEEYSTVIHSVGFLAADWKDRIMLIQNDGHDQVCGGIIIPKVSITDIKKLEVTNGIHDRDRNSE